MTTRRQQTGANAEALAQALSAAEAKRRATRTPAQRAADYRARKRGEDVPRRTPGPKPTDLTTIRVALAESRGELAILRRELAGAKRTIASLRAKLRQHGLADDQHAVFGGVRQEL